jgi:GT2 family glycosyltransferase
MQISLCMIVRDEAAMLADCLISARDAVDELIIVDTGSTDATREIARVAGAQVIDFLWCDDFAAARNKSIAHAQGDWVLYLDADERLAPGTAATIRAAACRDDFDCGLLAVHNASRLDASFVDVLSGSARMDDPVLQRRLMRRTPDLRFSGLVHEDLGQWLAARERRSQVLTGALIHLGYAPEVAQARGKLARNLQLLQRQVQEDPNDFTTYGYLAHTLLLEGKTDQAWIAAERGWSLVSEGLGLDRPSVMRLAAVKAQLELSRGLPGGALETLIGAERIQGAAPDFDFLRGQAHMALARASSPKESVEQVGLARAAYESARGKSSWVSSSRYIAGASGHRALCGLGQIALLEGRFTDAEKHFREAAQAAPKWVEAQVGWTRALLALDAQEGLSSLMTAVAEKPIAPLISALVAEHLGMLDDFANLLEQAKSDLDRTSLTASGWEALYAGYLRVGAYRGRPGSGEGVTGSACALMAGEQPGLSYKALSGIEASELSRFVRNLLMAGKPELVERLGNPGAEHVLPGIGELTAAATAEVLPLAGARAKNLADIEAEETGTVSVIVLTWNQLDATRRCVEGLRSSVRMDMELIAVDNGSTDGSVDFWKQQVASSLDGRAPVRVIFNPENQGFPVGCNQGLAIAQGEYVLFLNNDAIVHRGTVERMAAWLRSDPTIGLVGCRSNYAGSEQMILGSPRGEQSEVERFAERWVQQHDGMGSPCSKLIGLCLMGRREVFERIGGFDPRFTPGNFEDDDICVRVLRAGYRVWLAHDAFVDHEGHRTISKLSIDYKALLERNRQLFYAKWGGAQGESLPMVSARAARGSFDEAFDFISPQQDAPWPLSSSRSRRLLAWPRWDAPVDITRLLSAIAGLPSEAAADWSLCLRFDPQRDGSLSEALTGLEQAAEPFGADLDDLEVLLVDDPIDPADWPRLGAAVSASVALDRGSIECN